MKCVWGVSLQNRELPAQINNKNKQEPGLEQSTKLVEGEEGARKRGDTAIPMGCGTPGCSGGRGCRGGAGVILEGPSLATEETHARKARKNPTRQKRATLQPKPRSSFQNFARYLLMNL